jgi:hypothetical protein
MTIAQPKQHLKLDLISNGIDFVRAGIETFFKADATSPTDHKYAVVHMFAGTLLILKARLAKEHRALIFKNVCEAKTQNATTVTYKELLARLEACTNWRLDRVDRELLDKVQQTRNRIEHYECDFSLEETQLLVGDLAEFLLRFLHHELSIELEERLPKLAWEQLGKVKKLAVEMHRQRRSRWETVAQRLEVLDVAGLSEAEFQRLIAEVNATKPSFLQCIECSLATRRNPHPSLTVARLNNFGICTNSTCRALHGPTTCANCSDPLPPSRSTRRLCLSCWAELHLSAEEMYDEESDTD